jgi:hypothetical protein
MGEGRAIFHHQYTAALYCFGIGNGHAASHVHDFCLGVVQADVGPDSLDVGCGCSVYLIDDDDVSTAEVHLSGVVREFVSGAVGIYHHDFEISSVEGRVVIATVPENDVGFLFCLAEDLLVIDACVNDSALLEMRLVLFTLFDGALMVLKVIHGGEALHRLGGKVAIGHGVPDHYWIPPQVTKLGRDHAREGTLAASGANGTNRNYGHRRFDLSVLSTKQPKIDARGNGTRSQVHDVHVRDIAIRKDNSVYVILGDQPFHRILFKDGNSFGIQWARQLRGIPSTRNIGDLSRGESHDLKLGVVAKGNIEIVEVPTRSAKNQKFFHSFALVRDQGSTHYLRHSWA